MTEPWAQDVPPEVAPVRAGRGARLGSARRLPAPQLELGDDAEMTRAAVPQRLGQPHVPAHASVERRFVLRRPPFGVIAPGAHDMKREYRVLSRLWQHYDRAPRAFVFCDDHDVVGTDFVVSEYRRGEVVWAALPPSMADLPDAGRRIGLATVDALADLHLVDPAACGLADLGRPDGLPRAPARRVAQALGPRRQPASTRR